MNQAYGVDCYRILTQVRLNLGQTLDGRTKGLSLGNIKPKVYGKRGMLEKQA